MTPEAQRIAIAEACGWTYIEKLGLTGIPKGSLWGSADADVIPDYLSDLNACHEMIRRLSYEEAEQFEDLLWIISDSSNREQEYPHPPRFAQCNATAPQRCESFLRTLGKWVE